MKIKSLILEEFKAEMETTIKVLSAITDSIFQYSPHEKSQTIDQLVNHMVQIPSWVVGICGNSELDWATYTPPVAVKNVNELITTYKANVAAAVNALDKMNEEDFEVKWTMRKGDFTFFTVPKYAAFKKLIISHTIHHRAQVGLYLRLNDISVPATYVASADENLFG